MVHRMVATDTSKVYEYCQQAMNYVNADKLNPEILLEVGQWLLSHYATLLNRTRLASTASLLIRAMDKCWGIFADYTDEMAQHMHEAGLHENATCLSRFAFREFCCQKEACWDALARADYMKFGWGLDVNKYRNPKGFIRIDVHNMQAEQEYKGEPCFQ